MQRRADRSYHLTNLITCFVYEKHVKFANADLNNSNIIDLFNIELFRFLIFKSFIDFALRQPVNF